MASQDEGGLGSLKEAADDLLQRMRSARITIDAVHDTLDFESIPEVERFDIGEVFSGGSKKYKVIQDLVDGWVSPNSVTGAVLNGYLIAATTLDILLGLVEFFRDSAGGEGEVLELLKLDRPESVTLGRVARTVQTETSLEGMCAECRSAFIQLRNLSIAPARSDFDTDGCWGTAQRAREELA